MIAPPNGSLAVQLLSITQNNVTDSKIGVMNFSESFNLINNNHSINFINNSENIVIDDVEDLERDSSYGALGSDSKLFASLCNFRNLFRLFLIVFMIFGVFGNVIAIILLMKQNFYKQTRQAFFLR